MTDLLFDTPWWLPALIAAVGVVLFVTGNNRLETKVKYAGLGVVALAVVLTAVSYLVDTPVETAERRTRLLVDAFERADWPAMSAILDPEATAYAFSIPVYRGREKIMEKAQEVHGRHGFKSVNVVTMNSERADTVITVNTFLFSEQDAVGRTLNSDWQFEWQRRAEGWRLMGVRAVKIGNYTGDQVESLFPGR